MLRHACKSRSAAYKTSLWRPYLHSSLLPYRREALPKTATEPYMFVDLLVLYKYGSISADVTNSLLTHLKKLCSLAAIKT